MTSLGTGPASIVLANVASATLAAHAQPARDRAAISATATRRAIAALRKGVKFAAACLLIALSGNVSSQTPTPAAQPPRGQMPDLGRPTKNDDTPPLFDFDAYFPGTWTFEWDMPDGPFGPAGRLEGTTVYSALGGGRYQAVTEATGPTGKVTIKETITYQKEQKTLTREVTDSRGFSYAQKGTVGGDLGGLYYIYFESEPFTVNGSPVRVRHSLRLTAPLSYRLGVSVSESGGPFINNGNPWFRKQIE